MVILWCNYNNFDTIQTHTALRAFRASSETRWVYDYALLQPFFISNFRNSLWGPEFCRNEQKNDENLETKFEIVLLF